jgi:hypothetical protein
VPLVVLGAHSGEVSGKGGRSLGNSPVGWSSNWRSGESKSRSCGGKSGSADTEGSRNPSMIQLRRSSRIPSTSQLRRSHLLNRRQNLRASKTPRRWLHLHPTHSQGTARMNYRGSSAMPKNASDDASTLTRCLKGSGGGGSNFTLALTLGHVEKGWAPHSSVASWR